MRIDGPSRTFVANEKISRLSPTQARILGAMLKHHPGYTPRLTIMEAMLHRQKAVGKEICTLRKILAYHGLDLIAARGKGCRIVNGA